MQLVTDADANKKAMFTLYWTAFRPDTGWHKSFTHIEHRTGSDERGCAKFQSSLLNIFSISGSSCAIAPTNQRALDSETRTTTSTRFSHIFKFLFQLSQFSFILFLFHRALKMKTQKRRRVVG